MYNIVRYLEQDELVSLYIKYVNDFLTVEGFAEYHGITEETALFIIERGRKLNEKRAAK